MECTGFADGGQNLCLLLRRGLAARDTDRPKEDASLGHFRIQIIAFLQTCCLSDVLRQSDLRGSAEADEGHLQVSGFIDGEQ
jgi:hypothetical protein